MNKKSNVLLILVVVILVIGLLGLGAYIALNSETINVNGLNIFNNIKDETVTAENYEKISDRVEQELGDEMYYYAYACTYYIMKDGFTSEYLSTQDESLLYKNIYNKTVKQLVNEGKELMKEGNITIEQYKEQLKQINDNINELNNSINEFNNSVKQ